MWLGWILGSAFLLSFYDLCKKASVRDNAVFPCLLGSTLTGWLAVTLALLVRGGLSPAVGVSPSTAGLLLVKSCLVGGSWTATYMALRTLPITSAAPIRATGPLWTLIGAIAVFGERPTFVQGVGMALTLVGCWLFTRSARREGNAAKATRAIALAFVGTLLGSCSALYDKRLLQQLGIPTGTVLWWFMGGMCVIYAIACLIRMTQSKVDRPKSESLQLPEAVAKPPLHVDAFVSNASNKDGFLHSDAIGTIASTGFATASPGAGHLTPITPFRWRWTIPLVGILLAASDTCFFTAVSFPDAKISVLSLIRRSSVVLTFLIGGAVFRETNLKRKAFALAFIVFGVLLLCLK